MSDSIKCNLQFCVACDERIEKTADGYANHHCRKSRESARRSAHTRAADGYMRTPPLWERLADGFKMLHAGENDEQEESRQ